MEKNLELNPKDMESLINLAHLKTKLSLYDEALKDYEILLQNKDDKNLHVVYNNIANLHKKLNNYELALVDINKSIELKSDYDIGYSNRANIYFKLGDKLKACSDFKKALQLGIENNKHYKPDDTDIELSKICN